MVSTLLQCRDVMKQKPSKQCWFIKHTKDCEFSDGYINYLQGAFCSFPHSLFPLAVTLYVNGLLNIEGKFPVWALVLLIGVFISAISFLTTSNQQPPRLHCTFSLLGFVVSAMWINTAATEVVSILRTFGVVFDLSNTVLGLTLLAWGNSIGDCFSDITMARQGYPRMAMAACFGGIIFSILSCAAAAHRETPRGLSKQIF
ncbi:UNVERIFIED_CONTAM: hypothetical protein FKN15_035144 [Acipenser sinensis]